MMDPELWMDGKFKAFLKSPDQLANDSTRYSYKASLNIEIEQTFNNPFHSKTFDNASISGRSSLFSKRSSVFEDYRDSDSLLYQFLEILEAFSSPDQVFDMISSFVSGCADAAETQHIRSSDKTWLENEKTIWRLIYALYQNRLHYIPERMDLFVENESDIMRNFFQNNESIRECQLVVDWLEECAAERIDRSGQPKMSHFTDKTVAWENTLHQLQVTNIAFSSQRPLVSSMDPDAPQREKKQLHDLDAEDEARLLEQIYLEIRCGRLNKALEICNLCGHKWRAAILQGWMLFNDPNYKNSDDSVISAFGNPHRDIWKLCAWELTEKSNSSTTWKAVLSVFCGNLPVLLSACTDWEDLLWAYFKVYIDVKVENEIRAVSSREFIPLPDQFWDFKFTIDEIFDEIAGHHDNNIRIEAAKPERIIQRFIITNRIPELLAAMAEWCENPNVPTNLVRVCAHIIICLRIVGLLSNKQKAEEILKCYVKILMRTGDSKLVAFYTAMLSEEDQINYYSEFLQNVDDESERLKCLEAAELCHLQIEEITKRVVQLVRSKSDESDSSLNLTSGITKEDEKKISALDLMMHYSQQRDEALWETNALIRYFLSQRNLQAANYAFCKIPENSVELILQKYDIDENMLLNQADCVPSKIFAVIREYFCYRVYLNAEVRFADWFHSFHKLEPMRPQKPADDVQYAQKVGYEHQLNEYNTDYQKWKSAIDEQTKIVKSHLYNVLLFPDGGWLIEKRHFDDATRIHQMNALRKLCIPKIVILLHTVLHSMKQYDECLKLAEIISSENYQIYKAYSTQDLGEVLKKIGESSICLLDAGKDPFGLPVSS